MSHNTLMEFADQLWPSSELLEHYSLHPHEPHHATWIMSQPHNSWPIPAPREWHGFTKPIWVLGIGSDGSGVGMYFPTYEQQNEPKWLSIEWVMIKTVNWECFDHNSLISWPFWLIFDCFWWVNPHRSIVWVTTGWVQVHVRYPWVYPCHSLLTLDILMPQLHSHSQYQFLMYLAFHQLIFSI